MRRGWAGRRDDDAGQLMLLSGIVITIAFILTALTLSQVAALERQAASDRPSDIADEWRFLHERLDSNLDTAVTPDLQKSTFTSTTWPAIVATFRAIEAEKGYDAVVRLAGDSLAVDESSLTSGGAYDKWSLDGSYHFQHPFDGSNDGIIEIADCPDNTVVGGCIVGVYVFISLSDGTNRMEEYVLFAVNTDG